MTRILWTLIKLVLYVLAELFCIMVGAILGGCTYPLFFPVSDGNPGDGLGILAFAFVGLFITGAAGPFLILFVLRLIDKRCPTPTV